jgi:hypothetical protein
MSTGVQATPYGSLPVASTPEDVSRSWTFCVDLRSETGAPGTPDESRWAEPGSFTRAVFPTMPGFHPVGEVRLIILGEDVRLVGARTGREDVVEVTVEEVRAMRKTQDYAAAMRRWLQGE